MGMLSLHVMGMIMTRPAILRVVVRYQEAFAMVPTIAEDVIILLAHGGLLILAQAIPLPMEMFLDTLRNHRYRNDAITRSFEKEAVMDIHQAVKAEFFVNPANFWQQFPAEGHQVAFNGIDIRACCFMKVAQVICYQAIGT